MAKKVKKAAKEAAGEAERSPLLAPVRRVLLAGIGAVALAQDEAEDFVDKLVERGQIAEADGKKLVRDLMDRRKREAKKAEKRLDRQVEEVLTRMNIPTKAEIEALGDKIAELTKKVEELKQA